MTTTRSAVVFGAGGLLGSAVSARLRTGATARPVLAATGLPWRDGALFAEELTRLRPEPSAELSVHWCAGAGHVGADPAALRAETALVEHFAAWVAERTKEHDRVRVVFASSAGAVWSAAPAFPVDAATPAAPGHAYGTEKLAQERLVAALARDVDTVRIARISNLYGGGQRLDKPQGLLSHLVANVLRNRPTAIFVPLDTARDYVWTTDAARDLVGLGDGIDVEGAATSSEDLVRIVAAGRAHTIAGAVALLGRIMRRRVPLTHSVRAATAQQPRLLAFRPDSIGPPHRRVTLEEGLRRLVDMRVGVS